MPLNVSSAFPDLGRDAPGGKAARAGKAKAGAGKGGARKAGKASATSGDRTRGRVMIRYLPRHRLQQRSAVP